MVDSGTTIFQLTLDDAFAQTLRDAAIARADEHADDAWREVALETVLEVAQEQSEFTTDDVLAKLKDKPVATHEMRALGPVMLRAASLGKIDPTDRFITSSSVSRHRAPKRVWRSCVHQPAPVCGDKPSREYLDYMKSPASF